MFFHWRQIKKHTNIQNKTKRLSEGENKAQTKSEVTYRNTQAHMSTHWRQLHLKPPPEKGEASHLAMQVGCSGHQMGRLTAATTLTCGEVLKSLTPGHAAVLNEMGRFLFHVKEERES